MEKYRAPYIKAFENSIVMIVNSPTFSYNEDCIQQNDESMILYRDDFKTTIYNILIDSTTSLVEFSDWINNKNPEYEIINDTFVKGDYIIKSKTNYY